MFTINQHNYFCDDQEIEDLAIDNSICFIKAVDLMDGYPFLRGDNICVHQDHDFKIDQPFSTLRVTHAKGVLLGRLDDVTAQDIFDMSREQVLKTCFPDDFSNLDGDIDAIVKLRAHHAVFIVEAEETQPEPECCIGAAPSLC